MKVFITWFKLALAVVGAWIGNFVGGLDGFMYALIIFVCIDYITGVLAAIVQKELSSSIGFKGLIKKVAIFLLVGLANVVDQNVLQTPGVLRMAVIFYYISNEGISILENYTEIGLPVPKKWKEVLLQLRKRADEEEDAEFAAMLAEDRDDITVNLVEADEEEIEEDETDKGE